MSDEATLVERLEEIEKRTNAATPGPWRDEGRGMKMQVVFAGESSGVAPRAAPAMIMDGTDNERNANAAFIAAARTDVPWLIEQVRARDPALSAKDTRIREMEAEVVRLRNILDDDGITDPELMELAGKPMSILEAAAETEPRTFNPDLRRARAARLHGEAGMTMDNSRRGNDWFLYNRLPTPRSSE